LSALLFRRSALSSARSRSCIQLTFIDPLDCHQEYSPDFARLGQSKIPSVFSHTMSVSEWSTFKDIGEVLYNARGGGLLCVRALHAFDGHICLQMCPLFRFNPFRNSLAISSPRFSPQHLQFPNLACLRDSEVLLRFPNSYFPPDLIFPNFRNGSQACCLGGLEPWTILIIRSLTYLRLNKRKWYTWLYTYADSLHTRL